MQVTGTYHWSHTAMPINGHKKSSVFLHWAAPVLFQGNANKFQLLGIKPLLLGQLPLQFHQGLTQPQPFCVHFFCTSPFVLVAFCGSPFINLGNDITSVVQQSPEPDRVLHDTFKQRRNPGQPLAIGNGSPKSCESVSFRRMQ